MNGILDSVMARAQAFRPQGVTEYTALQVAKKLGDSGRLWKYLSLFDHHPTELIAEAYTKAQARGLAESEMIAAFEDELTALTKKEDNDEF